MNNEKDKLLRISEIADFFGVPREAIFPLRTNGEIAYMREEERKQKEINEKKKAEREKQDS